MPKIVIELPQDRDKPGTLTLVNKWGTVIAGPYPALGRAWKKSASAAGNPERNPLLPYGDTPTGEWNVDGWTPTGEGTDKSEHSYGPYGALTMRGVGGDAALAATLRTGILIHGGAPKAGTTDGLRVTQGCIRLSNDNMNRLLASLAVQAATEGPPGTCFVREGISVSIVEVDTENGDADGTDPPPGGPGSWAALGLGNPLPEPLPNPVPQVNDAIRAALRQALHQGAGRNVAQERQALAQAAERFAARVNELERANIRGARAANADDQARQQEQQDRQRQREQAEREQRAREQQAREQQQREQQEQERAAQQEQQNRQLQREQAEREQQAREQQAREQRAREERAREQQRQQQEREQQARQETAAERAVARVEARQEREQRAAEQAERERAAREQAAREQAAREQAAREQAAREQAAREQAAREQAAREQAARERAERERRAREQEAQRRQQQQAQQQQEQQQFQFQQNQLPIPIGHPMNKLFVGPEAEALISSLDEAPSLQELQQTRTRLLEALESLP